jgi:hypothetical protein
MKLAIISEDTNAAYVTGRNLTRDEARMLGEPWGDSNSTGVQIRAGVDSWAEARWDHGHCSYWGVAHIRAMRAYWLGRLRAWRAQRGVGG